MTQRLISCCDLLLVLAEPVPNALAYSRLLIDDLVALGAARENVLVVAVNRIRSDTQLTMAQIESQIGQSPVVMITPMPELIYMAIRMKTIAIGARPESLTAQQFAKLASAVVDFEKKK
jgi:MinD-like ATPase involved in chromosome partitioning or flagellar assembly